MAAAMVAAVSSQAWLATHAAMRARRASAARGLSASAWPQAATKADASSTIATRSPNIDTTSRIGVLTIGLPAAMYSRVLVGLMKRVDSLRANGISATSQPATSCGSTSYDCCPSQWRFGRCGSDAGSILTTGPTITTCVSGRASASAATRLMSRRSSMTPKKPKRGDGRAPCSASAFAIAAASAVARACEKCTASTALGRHRTFGCSERFAS